MHPGAVRLETAGPNEIWPADLKGQFKTGDRKYCFPLTVTDPCSRTAAPPQQSPPTAQGKLNYSRTTAELQPNHSRLILRCKALRSIRIDGAKPAFRTLFREYGLPDAIRRAHKRTSTSRARISGSRRWAMTSGTSSTTTPSLDEYTYKEVRSQEVKMCKGCARTVPGFNPTSILGRHARSRLICPILRGRPTGRRTWSGGGGRFFRTECQMSPQPRSLTSTSTANREVD